MLLFDSNGLLLPPKGILASMEEIEKAFVADQPFSKSRKAIFENYRTFLNELLQVVEPPFSQFLDGSFVTQKLHPNDLDVVTFIDFEVFEKAETALITLKKDFSRRGVGAYFQAVFEQGNPLNELNFAYWIDTFTRDRKRRPKGFVKIDF